MTQEWDISLKGRVNDKSETLRITVPAPIGRALLTGGYDRAVLTVTEEGLLYRPYRSEDRPRQQNLLATVDLPFVKDTA